LGNKKKGAKTVLRPANEPALNACLG